MLAPDLPLPSVPAPVTALPAYRGTGQAPPRGNDGGMFQEALARQVKRPDPGAETVNIAQFMKKEELSEIGELVVTEYEQDEASREEWLELHASWLRLYFLQDRPKNPPWPGSSSESLPILSEGCNQFHARAYKSFFAAPKFIAATPIGKASRADHDRAERVGNYMSWQLSILDRSYKRNKDRLLKALPLHGSFFTKTYRDPSKDRNVVENVHPVDMVLPYSNVALDIEDLERKTQIISLPLRKGKYLRSTGFFIEEPVSFQRTETNPVQEAADQATGIHESDLGSDDKGPARILEQHRYLDLDGDGIEEPYICWVDAGSRKLLRVAIRYDVDELGEPLSNKDPIEYFTHYVYLENPNGIYALGLGHLTGSMNSAANKIVRQAIDAGTLQNMRTGLISKSAGLPKGKLEVEIGKVTAVDGLMDDIRKALMFIDYPAPSQALIGLLEMIVQRADRLNMVTDLLTGSPEKVYQPTTALSQIEQALVTFTAVQTRVYASLESELQKLYRLNGMYVRDEEHWAINDIMGLQQGVVSKDDFAADLQVAPTFDLNSATETAKMNRAQQTVAFAMQNPLIQSSPPHLYEVSKRYFEAIGETAIEQLLPDPEVLAAKEQEAKQMQEQQMALQTQQTAMQVQEKAAADQVDDQIEAEKLALKREELALQKMKLQTDAAHKVAATEIKAQQAAEKSQIERYRTAAEIEQADDMVEVEKARTAAQFESAVRKLKDKGEK